MANIGIFAEEVNKRETAQTLTEVYTIPSTSPYRVRLNEKPDRVAGIGITGYTQVSSLPTAASQFYVDWARGYLYFYSANAGASVTVQYFGWGSQVDAEDINAAYQEITNSRNITNKLRPSAQSTANKTIKIEAGNFFLGTAKVSYAGNTSISLATGTYQVSAMTANYFKKILFTIDSSGVLKKYEGTAAQTSAGASTPSFLAGEIPVCIVTVQDDGSATAGSVRDINAADVEDVRSFLQAPTAGERNFLTIYYEGSPTLNEVFFNGFTFSNSIKMDRGSIFARTAPGSTFEAALLKNNTEIATLTLGGGLIYKATSFTAIAFGTTDLLGLKVKALDNPQTIEGIQIILDYYLS